MWKNEKFSLTEKKFRQINYLVISLVKPLLSRNFCQKSVRENFCNFHTMDTTLHCIVNVHATLAFKWVSFRENDGAFMSQCSISRKIHKKRFWEGKILWNIFFFFWNVANKQYAQRASLSTNEILQLLPFLYFLSINAVVKNPPYPWAAKGALTIDAK